MYRILKKIAQCKNAFKVGVTVALPRYTILSQVIIFISIIIDLRNDVNVINVAIHWKVFFSCLDNLFANLNGLGLPYV